MKLNPASLCDLCAYFALSAVTAAENTGTAEYAEKITNSPQRTQRKYKYRSTTTT